MWSNKKADERILSIYLFIVYIIVGVGIVGGVLLFYGPLDVRGLEAGVLSGEVINCLVEQGELKEGVLGWENLDECHFDFKDNSGIYEGEEQYYVRVEFYDFDGCSRRAPKDLLGIKFEGVLTEGIVGMDCGEEKIPFIELGRKDFFEYCGLKGDKLPWCDVNEIYVLDKGDKVLLRVYGVVGKVVKNE